MRLLLIGFTALLLSACGDDTTPSDTRSAPNVAEAQLLEVYKSPTCGCCGAWVKHMRENGFEVRVHETQNLNPIKQRAGILPGQGSCHTAFIGDYVIEGHVPANDVKRLLEEQPDARGLTVPGMPVGSPGMEMGDRVDDYEVRLFDEAGSRVYARYPQSESP